MDDRAIDDIIAEAEAEAGRADDSDSAALVGGEPGIALGTPGDDVIDGTPDRDLAHGYEGDDLLSGGAGDDELLGGAGR